MTEHILSIKLDPYQVEACQEAGHPVDPKDHNLWITSIKCSADREDWGRDCVTWQECDCELTEEEREDLLDGDDQSCPESPTSLHTGSIPDFMAAIPTRGCWVQLCDDTSEAIYELAAEHELEPGEYRISWTHPYGEILELELIDDAVPSSTER